MDRYTRRQLYAVVSDVASYESFVPYCTHSRILRPLALAPTPATPNAQQMEAELTVTFLAFTERYTSRVTCVPCESVKVCLSIFCFFFFCILYIGKREKAVSCCFQIVFSLTSAEL
jgi:ribosome-associated toxin RatA of RatAB toxin-antitoxin module